MEITTRDHVSVCNNFFFLRVHLSLSLLAICGEHFAVEHPYYIISNGDDKDVQGEEICLMAKRYVPGQRDCTACDTTSSSHPPSPVRHHPSRLFMPT